MPSRIPRIAAIAAVALSATAATAAADYQSDFDQAKAIGVKGYVYGIPLVDMQKTMRTFTSVNVPVDHGYGPINNFSPIRKLATVADHEVVAPNHDTLYTEAWLDLTKGPLVMHVPDTGKRFNVVPFLDPYEENFADIGSGATGLRKPGDYLILGPGQTAPRKARGLKVVRDKYTQAWIIMRTFIDDSKPSDQATVNRIQDKAKLVPLSKWLAHGFAWTPKRPKTVDNVVEHATIPGTQPGEDRLAFWDELAADLKKFPPPAADAPELAQLAQVGITPGQGPARTLSQGTLDGLRAAVDDGPAAVQAILSHPPAGADAGGLFQQSFPTHNGWLVAPTGNYGTDYELRAAVDKIGLGALPSNVALYPVAQTDRTGALLDGSKRYVVHLTAPGSPFVQQPLPADAFWSITLYGPDQFFVDNPANRYLVNDRSGLNYNADGSLDIYVQATEPTNPAQAKNWLPSPPSGLFRLTGRLYGPPADRVAGILDGSGWKPWTVLPCQDDGKTVAPPVPGFAGLADRIDCAS